MTVGNRVSGRWLRTLPVLAGLLAMFAVTASPALAEEAVYINAIVENLKGGHTGVRYISINQGEGFEGTACINEYETGGAGVTPGHGSKNCAPKNTAATDNWVAWCGCVFLGHAQVWNAHGSPAHIWGWWAFS